MMTLCGGAAIIGRVWSVVVRLMCRAPWAAMVFVCSPLNVGAAGLSPDAQEAVEKGQVAAAENQYRLAVRYFREALKASPEAPELFGYLGISESNIPGHELRAICWYAAYLAKNPRAKNIEQVRREINTLEVKGRANQGQMIQLVRELADKLPDAASRARGRVEWARLLADEGDLAAARNVVTSLSGEDRDSALGAIAVAQAASGDLPGAMETVKGISHNHDAMRDYASREGLDTIREMIAAGDIQGAKASALLLSPGSYQNTARHDIAVAQAKSGDMAGAHETRKLIDDQATGGRTFLDVAVIAANNGKLLEVGGKMVEVKAELHSGLDWVWRRQSKDPTAEGVEVAGRIGGAFARIGDLATAREIWKRCREHAAAMADVGDRYRAYRWLAEIQYQSADLAAGRATMQLLTDAINALGDARSKFHSLMDMADLYRDVHDISGLRSAMARAVEVLEDSYYQKQPRGNCSERSQVADYLVFCGDLAEARAMVNLALSEVQEKRLTEGERAACNDRVAAVMKAIEHGGRGPAPRLAPGDPITAPWWLSKLDEIDNAQYDDIYAYLKTVISSDPSRSFYATTSAISDVIATQNEIERVLRRQLGDRRLRR